MFLCEMRDEWGIFHGASARYGIESSCLQENGFADRLRKRSEPGAVPRRHSRRGPDARHRRRRERQDADPHLPRGPIDRHGNSAGADFAGHFHEQGRPGDAGTRGAPFRSGCAEALGRDLPSHRKPGAEATWRPAGLRPELLHHGHGRHEVAPERLHCRCRDRHEGRAVPQGECAWRDHRLFRQHHHPSRGHRRAEIPRISILSWRTSSTLPAATASGRNLST